MMATMKMKVQMIMTDEFVGDMSGNNQIHEVDDRDGCGFASMFWVMW